MKNNIVILLLESTLLASCVTESKVNNWLGKHPDKAAEYCADRFPPDTLTKTVIEQTDSTGYYDAYMGMAYLADSLTNELQRKSSAATPDKPYKPNIDSIRAVIDKEIRKRLKPCLDTVKVVTNTVIDRAKETSLKYIIDEKDKVISVRDKRNTELEEKVKAKNKYVWMFWSLVALIGGYTLLRLKGKL